jgi:hypothetical protein
MGFFEKSGQKVRRFFAQSPDRQMADLRRGGITPAEKMGAGGGYSLMQANGYGDIAANLAIENDLASRYGDYEEMDDLPETTAVLNFFADDATVPDLQHNKTLWIRSEDTELRDTLDDMLHKRVRVEDDIWGNTRTTAKYGSSYGEILVGQDGVVGLNHLPTPTVRRIEDLRGNLLGYMQDTEGQFNMNPEEFLALLKRRKTEPDFRASENMGTMVFEPWEIVHWRLRGKHMHSLYGHGVLDGARWIVKRMIMLEDAILLYKLTRTPQRFAFYIDTGNMDLERGMASVERIKNRMRKQKYINPLTQRLDMRMNPLPVAHDTPIALLDGRTIKISEMEAEHRAGAKHWVYSIDRETGHVVPGEVSWVGKTREKAPAVKVTFDDGGSLTMAPDHPVMRRDRSYVNAQDLQAGDSVMPFYRRTSDKAKGDTLHGYELVYDPEEHVSKYTHRVVSAALGLHQPGQLIHHKSLDRRNNDPTQLEGMGWAEHRELHKRLGQTGGIAMAMLRKSDPVLDAKMRAAASRIITAFNQSDAKRAKTSVQNRERGSARFIRAYNASEKHGQDNVQRSEAMTKLWADPARSEAVKEKMRLKIPAAFVDGVKALMRANPGMEAEDVVRAVNESSLLTTLKTGNTKRIRLAHRHLMLRMYRQEGFDSFRAFRSAVEGPTNHKVVSVEFVESCDHYCMTVERWHNFAAVERDAEGQPMLGSGVFVKNSQDEDFWVPSRNGRDSTRIEALNTPDWAETGTLTYHREKLVAALGVPKSYLGFGDDSTKGSLSSEDIRFARTVMRLQRTMRQGYRQVCRVHLIASGWTADHPEYDVMMTVPSAILELAKLEVMSARADIMERLGERVSLRWMLTKLFGLTEDEAFQIMQERKDEVVDGMVSEAIGTAIAEREAAKYGPAVDGAALADELDGEGGGAGGAGGGGDEGPPPEVEAPEGEEGRLRGAYTARLMRARSLSGNIRARSKVNDELRFLAGGGKEAERRAGNKLDRLLKDGTMMGTRMAELKSLLGEIRAAQTVNSRPVRG